MMAPLSPSRDVAFSEDELRALGHAAASVTPEIEGLLPDFALHVARVSESGGLPPRERIAELGIAFACARGIASAQRRLDALLTVNVARAVAKIDASPAFADVVAQDLRAKLLMGERPRIAEYAGRGSLDGWLRTAATRIALNLHRSGEARAHRSLTTDLAITAASHEVALLRAQYRGDLEEALRLAVKTLSARDRALLRLNVGDGLSGERIATLYRVGGSTAKRWLTSAREHLARETQRILRSRLALSPSEYDSVVAAVRSEVNVSLVRLLDEETPRSKDP